MGWIAVAALVLPIALAPFAARSRVVRIALLMVGFSWFGIGLSLLVCAWRVKRDAATVHGHELPADKPGRCAIPIPDLLT